MDEMLKRVFELIGQKRGAQKDLAEHLGVHPNVITNWKNGSNKSYRGYINEIAEFYGTTTDYLLTGEQKEQPTTDNGDELNEYLDELRTRPEMRMLFSLAKGATKQDVEKAVAIIEALRKAEGK